VYLNFKKSIMKKFTSISLFAILFASLVFVGCASWNKTQKGAVVGTAAGGAVGAVIGRTTGNTEIGAIIGATVGGAIIGNQMDKQAEEIKNKVPDARVERVGEGIIVEFNSNILFGFDQSNLSDEAKTNLDKLVLVLNSYSETDIEIQGHTDSRGAEAYNQNLSIQRAGTVSNYLVQKGISNLRLTVRGFGENTPRYDNSTAEGRSLNRRVEFLITANEKMRAEAEKQATK
jgi:outer membrane protein OmpA-like peptidoglycan-associated protein